MTRKSGKEYTSAYKEMGLVDKIDVVYNYKTDVDVWSNPSNTFWHNVGPSRFPDGKGKCAGGRICGL